MSLDEIQGLLESLSAELGSSLVLDDAEQHLIAHTGHGGSVDEVRRESILGRGAQPDVRRWFEQWGIRDAVTPIRTPADLNRQRSRPLVHTCAPPGRAARVRVSVR